jgi:hypothetical protein
MQELEQQKRIYYRNHLVTFIDFESERNGCIHIYIGNCLLLVKINELSN